MSDSADYYSIHEGVWTNWSRGHILGSTITLNRRDGGLLISFITMFITIVGTAFWRTSCFALHHYFSSEAPRDALYHQQQAVLRNSANGSSGLLSLSRLLWAWRRYKVIRPYRRMLPTIILAIFFMWSFSVAGIFSSKIATSTGTEVLLSSSYCGIQGSTGQLAEQAKTLYPYTVQRTVDSANYAQKCYTNTSSPEDCRLYVKKQLPWTSNHNASCPFAKEICKNQYNNIEIDTGLIDSNDHLGMNSPPSERVNFRGVMNCAPLELDKFETKVSSQADGMAAQLTQFHLGESLTGLPGMNATFEKWDYSILNQTNLNAGFWEDYSIKSMMASFRNGSLDTISDFDPIPQIRGPQTETHMYFLSSNDIIFSEKTDDPWYSAHDGGTVNLFEPEADSDVMKAYKADDVASVLGCTFQNQVCNPNLPAGKQCTPLASPSDTSLNSEELWTESSKTKPWKTIAGLMLTFNPIHQVQHLGISALTSRQSLIQGMQGPLPDNQWQLDVEHWFKGGLALLQAMFVEYATGPVEPKIRDFVTPPKNAGQRYLCNNQKILTTAYTNFNTFGLCLTFAVGGIIIIVAYTLEPFISFIQHRRYGLDKYSRLEWCTNETLQLQRLAHEELGVGTWHGGADEVPRTKPGEQLAMLDLTNLEHPRLKAPPATMDEVLVAETADVKDTSEVEVKEARADSVGDGGTFTPSDSGMVSPSSHSSAVLPSSYSGTVSPLSDNASVERVASRNRD